MKIRLICLLIFCTYIGFSQSFNKEVILDNTPYLISRFTKEALLQKPYSGWFKKNYSNYKPNNAVISQLKNKLPKYTITLFMGTWCGDSKREVPKFYKILEEANFPMERLTSIAVSNEKDTYKQSPGGEHEGLNIHRVPAFILYEEGKEINRIVEHPIISLEEDLLNIIKGNYTPNYNGVTYVNELLESIGVEKFNEKQSSIIKTIRNKITNFSELNTYSNVLLYSGKTAESIAVSELNSQLYPNEMHGYMSLGSKYNYLQNKEKAIQYYQKALSLDPKNKMIKKKLNNLKAKL